MICVPLGMGEAPKDDSLCVVILKLYKDRDPAFTWVAVDDIEPFTTEVQRPGTAFREMKSLLDEFLEGSVTERLASLLYLPFDREREDIIRLQNMGPGRGHGVVAR